MKSDPVSGYFNARLLPVGSLQVVRSEDAPPLLTWTHPAMLTWRAITCTPDRRAWASKPNEGPVRALTYRDGAYAGGERAYAVVAVDHLSQTSLARSITLPDLAGGLASNHLWRGLFQPAGLCDHQPFAVRPGAGLPAGGTGR